MPDSSDAVDTYLVARFRIGLEQVLLDASSGYQSPLLAGNVETVCNQMNRWRYADRGVAYQYQGSMTVKGMFYRCRFWICEDEDGRRHVTDLSEFAPVRWDARLRIGDALVGIGRPYGANPRF
jgi:hypothetical protein